jgi:HlyD family secretion protein
VKRLLVWTVVLGVFAVGGWATYDVFFSGRQKGDARVVKVESKVSRRDFVLTVLATGTVKPEVGAQVNVGARISGKVEQLNAAIGDGVTKGQVIAVIEHEDLGLQVAQREAQLRQVQAQLAAETSQLAARLTVAQALVAQRESEVEWQKRRLVALAEQRQRELDTEQQRLTALGEERRAQVKTAEAAIAEAESNHAFATKDVGRMKRLFAKEMLAEQTLDKALTDATVAASRLLRAQEELALAEVRQQQDLAVQEEVVSKVRAALVNDVSVQQEAVVSARSALALAREELGSVEVASAATTRVLEATLPRLEAELAETKIRLSYASIKAPIDGVIGTISTQEGETVAAGFNAPTFVTVVDLTRLQVDAYVDEVDIGKVHEGQSATFTVDAFPETRFAGTVVAIYPSAVLVDNVVYYDVVLRIDSQFAGLLRPEMTANITIQVETRPQSLAVPQLAVTREGGTYQVTVVRDGLEETRVVEVGLEDGDWMEIVGGLSDDDVVVYPEREKVRRGERGGTR